MIIKGYYLLVRGTMKTKPSEKVVQANAPSESGSVHENTSQPSQQEKIGPSPSKSQSIDFNKEWKNGHKFFTAPEAKALNEILHREHSTLERFNKIKDEIKRPRNPLYGEPSPRDARGTVVMNPKLYDKIKDGSYLFPKNRPPSESAYRPPIEPMGKIGVPEEKYNVLGNTLAKGLPANSEDIFSTIGRQHQTRVRNVKDQDTVHELVLKEKAKRYEKQLAREMMTLQNQIEDKKNEILNLKSRYQI